MTDTIERGNNQISDTNVCGGKVIAQAEVCVVVRLFNLKHLTIHTYIYI